MAEPRLAADDRDQARTPGIIGSTGCERSRACTPDFSSTHNTTAFSGGW
jgi:hypothetical protein